MQHCAVSSRGRNLGVAEELQQKEKPRCFSTRGCSQARGSAARGTRLSPLCTLVSEIGRNRVCLGAHRPPLHGAGFVSAEVLI
jgi:hypothetical protein